MALPLNSHTNEYVFGRGKLFIALFNALNEPLGERFLGNCPGFGLTVKSEQFEHFSSTSGLRTKDKTVTTQVNFSASLTCDDISNENLALFLGGSVSSVAQVSVSVTDERIKNVEANREYQLGVTVGNPTGVRNTNSPVIRSYEGENAIAWTATAAKALGAVVRKVATNNHWYMATTAGTTGASEPTWPTNGTTVTDGTVVWRDMGLISYTVGTDVLHDSASGRIAVPATGVIATYLAYVPSGISTSLLVDYDATDGSRTQVRSGASGSVTGQLRFISDNASGSNRDLFIASCSIAPDGELPFITESELATMTLNIGVNERDTSTPTIIIDGRNV